MNECCYNLGGDVVVNSDELIGSKISDGIDEVSHKPMSL